MSNQGYMTKQSGIGGKRPHNIKKQGIDMTTPVKHPSPPPTTISVGTQSQRKLVALIKAIYYWVAYNIIYSSDGSPLHFATR